MPLLSFSMEMARRVKAAAVSENGESDVLSREEVLEILDARAQRFLGITGEEFLRRLELGALPDVAAVTHLGTIAGAESS
jgi:hypothetical protein